MSDNKAGDQPENHAKAPEAQAIKTADAQEARVAGASDMATVQGARTNASDGSLRQYCGVKVAEQEASIELISGDKVVSRNTGLTEKELLPRDNGQLSLEQLSQTAGRLAELARDNPALDPVAQLRKFADELPAGETKESFIKLAREQAAELSPEMRIRFEAMQERQKFISQAGLEQAGSFRMEDFTVIPPYLPPSLVSDLNGDEIFPGKNPADVVLPSKDPVDVILPSKDAPGVKLASGEGERQLGAPASPGDSGGRDVVHDLKDKVDHRELPAGIHEVPSAGGEAISQFKSVLNDPRRNQGEFQMAVGHKGKEKQEHATDFVFQPGKVDADGGETHTNPGAARLQLTGHKLDALIHTHPPGIPGKSDPDHFSELDKLSIDGMRVSNPEAHGFLLTPAPKNEVVIYPANDPTKFPNGEPVGFITKNGQFFLQKPEYQELFPGAVDQVVK